MTRSIFWLSFGLGLGVLAGMVAARRIDRLGRMLDPARVAGGAGRGANAVAERVGRAVREGVLAAEQREAALRADHDVPSLDEALGRSDGA